MTVQNPAAVSVVRSTVVLVTTQGWLGGCVEQLRAVRWVEGIWTVERAGRNVQVPDEFVMELTLSTEAVEDETDPPTERHEDWSPSWVEEDYAEV